jgi:hypothetical protein
MQVQRALEISGVLKNGTGGHNLNATRGLDGGLSADLDGPVNSTSRRNSLADINSMQSSTSSQNSSIRERMNNQKHFTENKRLQEVLRLYTTLQNDDMADEDILTLAFNETITQIQHDSEKRGDNAFASESVLGGSKSEGIGTEGSNKSFTGRVQAMIKRRIFKANYILIDNNAVTLPLYHLFMLCEFLQMLFFIFYKLEVTNEFYDFTPQIDALNASKAQAALLSGNKSSSIYNNNDGEDSIDTSVANFFFGDYFKFMNFPMYVLEQNSVPLFTNLYEVLSIIFLLFLAVTIGFADSFFRTNKTGEMKESTRFLVRILSIVLAIYIFILQIPMAIVYLQGYLCEEDLDEVYVLDVVVCGSSEHLIFIACSTIGLIIFLSFIVLERLLFNSRNFETDIPWGSLERKFDFLKLFVKLI